NTSTNIDPDIASGQTWVNGPDSPNYTGQRRQSFKYWWVGQMINQDRNILEKMTLFWHNHFAIEISNIGSPIWAYQNNLLLRQSALGNFKTLTKAVSIDPAMLKYLNGYLNTHKAPDENYARELQELFTLGKGPNSQYTEDDVKAAAKVLTGWRINNSTFSSYFDPNKHDTGNKQFSAFYNNTVITGQAGANGANEVEDLLTMIFNQTEVSLFICRKLYRWFVYYDIDATTEANVIAPMAQIFRQNNYDIKPVLTALFKSEHFFDAANVGCLIKSPLDFCVGLCRVFNIIFPDASQYATQYYMWGQIWGASYIQQQDPGDPPNVAGWPAYYQVPSYHELWINSDTLPKRNQISDLMVNSGIKKNGFTLIIDCLEAAKTMSDPSNPNTLIDDLCKYLHILTLSSTNKSAIKVSTLLSGQSTDSYWTSAWNAFISDPTNKTNKDTVNLRLIPLYKYLMDLSEFQLS
ncbi:MAG: DUF1800 domain-containing protein, partial [Bacteroidota bacterium]|nr:DUF1800 domain-containing protein [Bacteroidota bacterium]